MDYDAKTYAADRLMLGYPDKAMVTETNLEQLRQQRAYAPDFDMAAVLAAYGRLLAWLKSKAPEPVDLQAAAVERPPAPPKREARPLSDEEKRFWADEMKAQQLRHARRRSDYPAVDPAYPEASG